MTPAGSTTPHESQAFRSIVWKELHESLKAGAMAFAIVSIGWLLVLMFDKSMAGAGISTGGPSLPVSLFTFTSALVALMIGRSQMIRERRGDAWAFLTHRPVTRSTLFWGKAFVGAVLYIGATGIPLAFAMIWQATPGHRPMPFDARMTLPYIADLLCGLVYYAAALTIVMRDARWYGSRYLAIGAAMFCSSFVAGANAFPLALSVVVLGLIVVVTAARGTFISGGHYAPQSRTSRIALGLTLGVGLTVAGGIVVGIFSFVTTVGRPEATVVTTTDYEIASDAAIVEMTKVRHLLVAKSEVVTVKDLSGRPLAQYKDSSARGASLQAGVVSTPVIPLNPSGEYSSFAQGLGYRGTGDLFVQMTSPTISPSTTSWYFIRGLELVAAYDNQSARLIGWMGPDGFSAGAAMPAHRFDGKLARYTELGYKQPLLVFPNAVYRLNLAQRTIRKVYTASAGESVLGAAGSGDSTALLTTYGSGAQFDAIATTKTVYVQSTAGEPEVAAPRDSRAEGYGGLVVSRALRAPGAPMILWYSPRFGTLTDERLSAATDQITEVGGNNAILAQYTLPGDSSTVVDDPEWAARVVTALTTPIVVRIVTSVHDRLTSSSRARKTPMRTPAVVGWLLTILASLVAAALAFGIGRAYAFESKRLQLWTALSLALGPLAILLMLALIEWPSREVCPSCSNKRVVSREHCEHCGTPFGAPLMDGTEIFEPAA